MALNGKRIMVPSGSAAVDADPRAFLFAALFVCLACADRIVRRNAEQVAADTNGYDSQNDLYGAASYISSLFLVFLPSHLSLAAVRLSCELYNFQTFCYPFVRMPCS